MVYRHDVVTLRLRREHLAARLAQARRVAASIAELETELAEIDLRLVASVRTRTRTSPRGRAIAASAKRRSMSGIVWVTTLAFVSLSASALLVDAAVDARWSSVIRQSPLVPAVPIAVLTHGDARVSP